jgi:hypothetical protein
MKTHMTRYLSLTLLVAAVIAIAGVNTDAALVYEGFATYSDGTTEYADGTVNGTSGYNGGNGWNSNWIGSTTSVPFSVSSGSGHGHGGTPTVPLTFTGLSDTGNRVLGRKNAPGGAEVHRSIDGTVLPSLVADNSTIYFSILLETRYYSTGNENLAFLFGTDDAFNPNLKPVNSAGEAIGVALKAIGGGQFDFQAIAVDGGVTSVSAVGGLATGTPTIFMIVGEITWGAGSDTINLYNITDVNAALPTAFASLSADLDQSQFDTIHVAGQQVSVLDEIRVDTTLQGVGVIPEPASMHCSLWAA